MKHHLNIHYIPATGQITAFDNGWRAPGDEASHMDDSVAYTLEFEGEPPSIDQLRQATFDHETKTLIPKSAAEIAQGLLPTRDELDRAIYCDLRATDDLVDPPSDRPLKGVLTLDWLTYRQALRDASKRPGGLKAMIGACPVRPDGHDAFASLRARLSTEEGT